MSPPPADGPVRVLVADDHRVVRQGLRVFLATTSDICVVGEASDGSETLTQLDALHDRGEAPDVVLMDLLMSPMDGIEATRQIRARYPEVQVVALTSFVEEEKANAALDAGASGFLLKDADADEVAAAIRAARRGEVHLDPAIAGRLVRALRAPSTPRPGSGLTERERQVLRLVAAGKANKDIAAELCISERTARTHVSSILTKLGMTSRTQAALWAVREGLGQPPGSPANRRQQSNDVHEETYSPCLRHPWRCSIDTWPTVRRSSLSSVTTTGSDAPSSPTCRATDPQPPRSSALTPTTPIKKSSGTRKPSCEISTAATWQPPSVWCSELPPRTYLIAISASAAVGTQALSRERPHPPTSRRCPRGTGSSTGRLPHPVLGLLALTAVVTWRMRDRKALRLADDGAVCTPPPRRWPGR